MMKKFPDCSINNINYQSKLFVCPIPILCIEPEKKTNNSVVFIFNCGLGGTNKWNEFMCFPIFQENYFISYEKASHGNNKNKPSQYRKKTLIELQEVILFVRNKYPNRKIYLLGESWGSSINFLYLKQYGHKYVDGVVNWNMPYKPKNVEKLPFFKKLSITCKIIFTWLFNIGLNDKQSNFVHDKLSQNVFLVRAKRIAGTQSMNTKLPICSWRFMKPSWRFLFKNLSNNTYNFLYIQTGQDILAKKKIVDKLNNNYKSSKKYLFIPSGFHVLTFEPKESTILYSEIKKFISK